MDIKLINKELEVINKFVDKHNRINWTAAHIELNKHFTTRTKMGWKKHYERIRTFPTIHDKDKELSYKTKIANSANIIAKKLNDGATIKDLMSLTNLSEVEVYGVIKSIEDKRYTNIKRIGSGNNALYVIDKTALS